MDYSRKVMARRHLDPKGCLLTKKGKATILAKKNEEEWLLNVGLEDPEELMNRSAPGYRFEGRGPLALLVTPGGSALIKQCLRGGLAGALNRDLFWGRVRPFEEMGLNCILLEEGFPTAEILAAVKLKAWGPFYRAFLVMRELPESIDLLDYLKAIAHDAPETRRAKKAWVFRGVASSFKTMHRLGVFHGDLNVKNILVREERSTPIVHVIDFDKSRVYGKLTARQKGRNLMRFNRSMEKVKFKEKVSLNRSDQMRFFRAYLEGEREIEAWLRKHWVRNRLLLALHRLSWKLLG
jgi:tRNA A-37 threonylcarbamoyl transferase component Bud32